MTIISSILVVLSITGGFLNAAGKRSGFWFWGVANLGWIAYCWVIGEYPQMALWCVYLVQCVQGLLTWKHDK